MSVSIQEILRQHRDTPNVQIIAKYHDDLKRIARIDELEKHVETLRDALAEIQEVEMKSQPSTNYYVIEICKEVLSETEASHD